VLEYADEVDARWICERVLVDRVSNLGGKLQEWEDLVLGKRSGGCVDRALLMKVG
jgi:hypothetical protein